MAKYYSDLGYSFKETLNAHVRSLGKDPDMIWSAAYDTIRTGADGLVSTVAAQLVPQLAALREGVSEVMPLEALRGFSPEEMLERYCGRADVQFGDREKVRPVAP